MNMMMIHKKQKVGSTTSKSAANMLKSALNKQTNNKPPAALKKYELMLKVGVDIPGIMTQMKKDKIEQHLIDQFKISHGLKSNTAPSTDLDSPKFAKYKKMQNLKLPMTIITNKMKLDGLTQSEIDTFSGKVSTTTSQETDPLKIAEQLGLPKKPKLSKPKQGMKKIHWEPVELEQIKSSIWCNVDQQWIDYDSISFELKFQIRKNKPKINKGALKHGVGSEKKHDDEEEISFVDAKRSQQVQIGLKSFHMTNEQLRCAILSFDETKMDADKIKGLIDIVPSPEEQLQAEKMSEDKDIKYFGIVERFFYSLYDIIELKQRLETWLFTFTFDEKIKALDEQLTVIERAKIAVMRSNNLKEIFGILLAFGNHMNYGNKRKGNAYGFHLRDLSLLPQIKTFDNSMTFPMFLYSFLKKKYSNTLKVIKEFDIVGQATNINSDMIEHEYDTLNRKVKDLTAMINRYKEEYIETLSIDDCFVEFMSKFEASAKKKIWKLKFKYDSFHKSEKQLINYFAYNTEEEHITIQHVFKDLDGFIKMLKSSKIKLKHRDEEIKKKARRRLARHKQKAKNSRRTNTETLSREKFTKLATPKKYALGLEDIGTPVGNQQMQQQVTYDNIMSHIDKFNAKHNEPDFNKYKKRTSILLKKMHRDMNKNDINMNHNDIDSDMSNDDLPELDQETNSYIAFLRSRRDRKSSKKLLKNRNSSKGQTGLLIEINTKQTKMMSPKPRNNVLNAVDLFNSKMNNNNNNNKRLRPRRNSLPATPTTPNRKVSGSDDRKKPMGDYKGNNKKKFNGKRKGMINIQQTSHSLSLLKRKQRTSGNIKKKRNGKFKERSSKLNLLTLSSSKLTPVGNPHHANVDDEQYFNAVIHDKHYKQIPSKQLPPTPTKPRFQNK